MNSGELQKVKTALHIRLQIRKGEIKWELLPTAHVFESLWRLNLSHPILIPATLLQNPLRTVGGEKRVLLLIGERLHRVADGFPRKIRLLLASHEKAPKASMRRPKVI